ncbi:RsmB/NOP family class I SAM-dependent RNA methyltransferase [Bifidobacterium callimiconis]|uniref:16S rRNA methyltransferase n=1 Tax=Bifidobacterium callimiconis TaxID=2306973 RepID=A0A430FGF6_9BIFI|nr:transcription antitermination factor NusB [Bifidobacterium callimiconis]MBT1176590.1 16S rRNA methyltransferase [Bifidobacterium callimiconis]RSX51954.1 16S rRNA methyltransferase [Bifidobacterium callimiconis]
MPEFDFRSGKRDSRRPGRAKTTRGRRPANKPAADPRAIAYDVTSRVSTSDSFTNLLLPKALASAGMDARGNAFATELVYGTQRWRGLLDAVIVSAAKRPATDIDDTVLDVLRIGTFQALFMNVPDHAVVSKSVDLARSKAGARSAGFVNAVMHRVVARSRQEWESIVVSRIGKGRPAERLGVRYSHPAWIVEELEKAWNAAGYAADAGSQDVVDDPIGAMLAADNEAPDVTLVARPGLVTRDELIAQLPDRAEHESGRWSPYAVRVHGVNPERLAYVRAGLAGVEDEGSQLAALALAYAPIEGDKDSSWLDMCAGPGGKTALLGSLAAQRHAVLNANEPSAHRARLVRDNVRALPDGTIGEVWERDGRELGAEHAGEFDRVLVDAPCSGLGSLRRRPEARWRKKPEDITELAEIQRALLNSALDATRFGGTVAYVTCSPALAETRAIVDAVLASRKDAERLDAAAVLRAVNPAIPLPERPGDVQLFEHLHGTDQMFISLIRKH